MALIKDTTMLRYWEVLDKDSSRIYSNKKTRFAHLNVYYKTSDFIKHGPENNNYGESFKDLIDKPFACFIHFNQIFVRVFLNQLKLVSNFVIHNYHESSDKQSFNVLEKTLFDIYCLHLKFLIKNINGILKTQGILNIFDCLVSEKIFYNKKQLNVYKDA